MNNEELKTVILSLISEINISLEEIQKKHSQSAYEIGITRENLNTLSPFFSAVIPNSNYEFDYSPLLLNAKDYLTSYKDQVHVHGQRMDDVFKSDYDITSSGVAFSTSSGTIWSVIDPDSYQKNKLTIPPAHYDRDYYYNRFSKVDAALGKTYKEIDEILFTTQSDAERAALYMVRQSFDHFFGIIAPNGKVKESKYWKEKKPKEDKNPDAVWRSEKIKYAAFTYIKDPLKAQNLVDQSKYILEIYELLNKAHDRKEINSEEAKNLIISMKTILEEWVVALDF